MLTCQIYKYQSSEQICIMNADGSGYRRLTTEDTVQHFYPSVGARRTTAWCIRRPATSMNYPCSVVLHVALTNGLGQLDAPEISPDGKSIVFTREFTANEYQIWVMGRDGSQPAPRLRWNRLGSHLVPDGNKILFASDRDGLPQLYMVNVEGSALHKLSDSASAARPQ